MFVYVLCIFLAVEIQTIETIRVNNEVTLQNMYFTTVEHERMTVIPRQKWKSLLSFLNMWFLILFLSCLIFFLLQIVGWGRSRSLFLIFNFFIIFGAKLVPLTLLEYPIFLKSLLDSSYVWMCWFKCIFKQWMCYLQTFVRHLLSTNGLSEMLITTWS